MTDLSDYGLAGRTGVIQDVGVRVTIVAWQDTARGRVVHAEDENGERYDNVALAAIDLDAETRAPPREPERADLGDVPLRQVAAAVREARRRGEHVSDQAADRLAEGVLRGER